MTIVVRNLGFDYPGQPVLRDITAEARSGRITAVIGPNAVGKTTLLRCVIGALRPSTGEAHVDGEAAARLSGHELARRIAYVAQRSSVAARLTVREVVALGRYALGADASRIEAALVRLELTDVADRPYPALSVGQQQRVSLARALAQLAPEGHLVLDEPTAAMDLRHARDCFTLLRELADQGHTVLLALHDLTAAADFADDAWLLTAGTGTPGRLSAAGAGLGEVMQIDRLRDVFEVDFEWVDRPNGRRVLLPGTRTEPSSATTG